MFYFFLFILGASVGSFLNVLIDRLPLEKSISGRSYCDHCQHKLSWYDLIPIVSFILLKGRCRYCGKKISFYYPLVEFLTGFSFVFITKFQIPNSPPNTGPPLADKFQTIFNFQFSNSWSLFGYWLLMIGYLGIISCLIVIFFSDLKYQIIPDWIQLFFFIFALIYRITMSQITPARCNLACYIAPLFPYFVGGFLISLPVLFLHLATFGRGMGFGDVKLAFNIGFLLGIKAGFLALYFGFVLGGVVGLILLLLKKKKLKSKIAFGPFLVVGIIIMLFWSKEVFEIINKIYGF